MWITSGADVVSGRVVGEPEAPRSYNVSTLGGAGSLHLNVAPESNQVQENALDNHQSGVAIPPNGIMTCT